MKTSAVITHLAAGFALSPLVALLVLAGPLTAHLVRGTKAACAAAPMVATPLHHLTPSAELTRQERMEAYEE